MRRQNSIRLIVRWGRLEIIAIEPHRFRSVKICEVMREGKGRTDVARKLGAVVGRAEQIDRRQRHIRRHRAHIMERMARQESRAFSRSISSLNRWRKSSSSLIPWRRPKRMDVAGSVPGAAKAEMDPPGIGASSTLKRSATINGAWLGSMTPPNRRAWFW